MHRLPLVLMEGGSHIAADNGILVKTDMKQSGQEKCKETQMGEARKQGAELVCV